MNRAARRRHQRANRKHGRGWTKPTTPVSAARMEAIAEGTVVLARMFGRTVPADRVRQIREPGRTAEPQERSWWRRVFRRAA